MRLQSQITAETEKYPNYYVRQAQHKPDYGRRVGEAKDRRL
jgi:hypothetical protein